MRKFWLMPATLAALLAVSCEKKVTETTVVEAAPAPKTPAHNQGKSCISCHDWNIVQLHDSASPEYNPDCMKCHGDMLDETTLSSSVEGIHPRMAPFVYQAAGETTMSNKVCTYCHKSVDFLGSSAGNLRRQVDVLTCVTCHTTAGPGRELYMH